VLLELKRRAVFLDNALVVALIDAVVFWNPGVEVALAPVFVVVGIGGRRGELLVEGGVALVDLARAAAEGDCTGPANL
jgi:hypothetical protein